MSCLLVQATSVHTLSTRLLIRVIAFQVNTYDVPIDTNNCLIFPLNRSSDCSDSLIYQLDLSTDPTENIILHYDRLTVPSNSLMYPLNSLNSFNDSNKSLNTFLLTVKYTLNTLKALVPNKSLDTISVNCLKHSVSQINILSL